jgi:2-dehydro-3-deoxygalactonokinase
MTGEVYALLRQQSILARSLPADDAAWVVEAFDRGVAQAQAPGGLLHHLFAVRALSLFDRQDGPWLASYLSGLLIGDELRAQALPAGQAVVAVGSALLTDRYQRALAQQGHPVRQVGAEAGWTGLLALSAALRG